MRPLVWLFIFAAGFRNTLGVSLEPPYQTYVLYEVYVVPGLAVMIQLFNGMQSSLSMVYDREVGSMKVLLTSPYPRWLLLLAKLIAGVSVSIVQAYAFLAVAYFWESDIPTLGYLTALPAFLASGLMLGAIGLFLSSLVRQLENFASVMNFVIFPMFFASSALYPLWRIRESSETLYWICELNPFSHAVQLVRFALYVQFEPLACTVVVGRDAGLLRPRRRRLRPGARHHGKAWRPGRRDPMIRCIGIALAVGFAAGPALSQPRPDPDWPCVQRKVSTLSPGQFWTGPDIAAAGDWGSDNAAAVLAQKLAARRTDLAEVDPLLDAYVAKVGADKAKSLTHVYAGVFEVINGERDKVVGGIARYAQGQRRMAERIRDEADKISQVKDSPSTADAAELPKDQSDLEAKFAWDRRIFQERSQSLTYVCEVPQLLEQRLGEIARKIQAHL